ncbi:rhodanese-like domain-containing protein [Rhodobacterales bacterium HKCCE2091]|nr:rhodanese-like domain-containing protein [Rhodobacterales bacterium HKCCE2091]
MPVGYKELLAEAEAEVQSVTGDDALALLEDAGVVFVDIRDVRELDREGMVPGSRHAPRGMLEFWIDPESPYHKPFFAEDRTFLFYCASGWRSLLAAQVAQRMGLRSASMSGGFGDWKRSGKPVAERERKPG